MYAKLAWRNVRRNARDYAIYFVTLLLGIAVFYAFNTIGDQRVLFDLKSAADERMLDMTTYFLSLFSWVVAFVLGFLVVYANRFLIKRRKREFGIYLTLGMNAAKVSRVILYETLLVGVVSLAVGLAAGILMSQGLSFATAALFGIRMPQYHFVFSRSALLFTVGCFAATYVLVAVLNVITIARCKLITLMSAERASEHMGVRHAGVRLAAFFVSVAVIACAYWQLHLNGLVDLYDGRFALATALMIVGTALFFWSLSGFVILLLQRLPGVYFRRVNMFTVRQIASKANTAWVSLSVACIMLFFGIMVFSTGMGFVELFTGDLNSVTRVDATIECQYTYWDDATGSIKRHDTVDEFAQTEPGKYAMWEESGGDMKAMLTRDVPGWRDAVAREAQVDVYYLRDDAPSYAELFKQMGVTFDGDMSGVSPVWAVGVSQYNGLCELLGDPVLQLGANEVAVDNTAAVTADAARQLREAGARGASVNFVGEDFAIRSDELKLELSTGMMPSVAVLFVVPDRVIDSLAQAGALPDQSALNVMYAGDRVAGDAALVEFLGKAAAARNLDVAAMGELSVEMVPEMQVWPASTVATAYEMQSQMGGLRMCTTYLALYLGFVLLVSVAAIMAIQQLSEAADSVPRYRKLHQLGADDRWVAGSLRTQVLVYFLAPLGLAACHVVCATRVLSATLMLELGVNIAASIAGAVVLICVVYGCYLAVTYRVARRFV